MCHEKGCFGRCRRGCCLFHLIPLSLRPIAFENSLGSGWLGGKKRSPLQMLYDLDQGPRSALAEVHRQRRDLLGRRLLGAEDLGTCWWTTRRPAPTATCPRWPAPTWKRVLLALSATPGGRPARHPRAPRRHAPARLPSLATSPRPRSNRRLCAPTWPSFFVREPFERWRPAAFQRALRHAHRAALRPLRTHDALARGHDVRFAEFLAYLLDPRTRREEPFNEHWERAHALCHPCRLRYDVVGKFETLAEDAAFVLGLVGAPGLRFPAPPPRAKAAAARDLAERLFRDISPFYQRRLFDLYRMDFLLFNYSAPSYLRLH
uniref:Carbohydrate sulfotransferase n=1 Tax=Ursus americanus TaxID=9643 RepID=A0A452SKZ2_URSAM